MLEVLFYPVPNFLVFLYFECGVIDIFKEYRDIFSILYSFPLLNH